MARKVEYYEALEEEVIETMKASLGIGGLCNNEVCESLLLHVRECYALFGVGDKKKTVTTDDDD